MFIVHTASAQARIGYTSTEIRTEFSDSKYNLTSGYLDGNLYIAIYVPNLAYVYYFFDSNYTCYGTSIKPESQAALNTFIEFYNKEYVIIDSTHWKMYSTSGVLKIALDMKSSGNYITWTRDL